MRACLATLLILASALCHGQFPGNPPPSPFGDSLGGQEFLPVAEAYRLAIEPQADNGVRLYWQIAEGYYLYQHRFAFHLEDQAGEIEVQASLPEALEREDEFFGQVQVYYHDADVLLKTSRGADLATLTVKSQGCADAGLCYPPQTQRFRLDFTSGAAHPIDGPGPAATGQSPARTPGDSQAAGVLLTMLMLAFIGGAILNLMPCVFPILSLKVLSFTRASDSDRHLHGWLYAAGVVLSFVAAAAILITLQQAGRAVGWGFQLQSPGFVIALAYLFVIMGLSLSGVLQLGAGMMNIGSGLAGRGGASGSFITGVLAVVVASPCTAPFMGSALGYAVTQPPPVALLIFAALGCGMAAPLLLLSYSATLRRVMPAPGPWMDTLKSLLAFPLYATAIWLLWVAGKQTGVNTMGAALAGALMLAMGLWLWRDSLIARLSAVACMALAVTLGSWRGLDGEPADRGDTGGRLAWSEQRVQALRAEGRTVFLDVTADWCITCIANEKAVLHTEAMTAEFADRGVAYVVADWTNYDPAIADLLTRHGRTGIPLYLLYPRDASQPPIILPQLLTRSTVLEALDAVSADRRDLVANVAEDGGR